MGTNYKYVRYDDSKLSNEKSFNFYSQIEVINEEIAKFTKSKNPELTRINQELEKVQSECGKSPEGHDLRIYKDAVSEMDHDTYKCQKCGKETT